MTWPPCDRRKTKRQCEPRSPTEVWPVKLTGLPTFCNWIEEAKDGPKCEKACWRFSLEITSSDGDKGDGTCGNGHCFVFKPVGDTLGKLVGKPLGKIMQKLFGGSSDSLEYMCSRAVPRLYIGGTARG